MDSRCIIELMISVIYPSIVLLTQFICSEVPWFWTGYTGHSVWTQELPLSPFSTHLFPSLQAFAHQSINKNNLNQGYVFFREWRPFLVLQARKHRQVTNYIRTMILMQRNEGSCKKSSSTCVPTPKALTRPILMVGPLVEELFFAASLI